MFSGKILTFINSVLFKTKIMFYMIKKNWTLCVETYTYVHQFNKTLNTSEISHNISEICKQIYKINNQWNIEIIRSLNKDKKKYIIIIQISRLFRPPFYSGYILPHLLYIRTSGFQSLLGVMRRSLTPPYSESFHLRL